MPTLAGWLTGEQVPHEVIDQTLTAMSEVLGRHGGQLARTIQPGAGLIAFSDTAYAMRHNDEPPVLDWVPARRTMVYHRPLSGAHSLYYVENWPAHGNLLFASEIKALLAVGVPRRLHLPALEALQRYGFIPAPWTIFQDIYVVPAGSILRWQRARTVVNATLDYRLDQQLAPADAAEQIYARLDQVVADLLPPHDQLVALSSGDTASALIALLAARHTQTPFTLATLGNKKRLDAKIWQDAEYIASLCEKPFLAITGVDNPDFWLATLAGLEAPSTDIRPLVLHQLLHMVSIEAGARVAMSGLGASILSGMRPDQAATDGNQRDPLHAYSQALTGQMPRQLWSQGAADALRRAESWEESTHARKLSRNASRIADKQKRWYYLDLHLRLPDHVVAPVLQLATPERIAVRSPYLHKDVLDMLTRIPSILPETPREQLYTTLLGRYTPYQRQAQPRTKAEPDIPVTSLLQTDTSELLRQTLSPQAIKAAGIFEPRVVEDLLRQKEVSRELLLVFTTQLLCKLFDVGL